MSGQKKASENLTAFYTRRVHYGPITSKTILLSEKEEEETGERSN